MASQRFQQLSIQTAMELLENPYSCLERISNKRRLPLPLNCVNKVYQGVRRLLEEETGRYSDELGGIVIAFDNVKLSNSYANIMEDIPYIVVDFCAEFIVFKPNIGSTLIGTVTKTGSYHISCLVHGCFNVALAKSSEYGLHERVKKGNQVVLEVLSVQYHSRIMQIEGKLLHIVEDNPIEDQASVTSCETQPAERIFKRELITSEDSSATIEMKEYKDRRKKKLKNTEPELDHESPKDETDVETAIDSGCTSEAESAKAAKAKKHKKEKKKHRSKDKSERSKSKKHRKEKKKHK